MAGKPTATKFLPIVRGGEVKENEEESEPDWDEKSEATFDSMDKATKTRKDRTASEIASIDEEDDCYGQTRWSLGQCRYHC